MLPRLQTVRRAMPLLLAAGVALLPAAVRAAEGGPSCSRALVEEPASSVIFWDEATAAMRAVVAVSPASDARMTVFVHCGARAVAEGVDPAAAPLSGLVYRAFQQAQQSAPFRSRFTGAVKEAARQAREAGTEDLDAYRRTLEKVLHDDLFGDSGWVAEWSMSLLDVLTESGRSCADCPLPSSAGTPASGSAPVVR